METPILPLAGRGFNQRDYGSGGYAASHEREAVAAASSCTRIAGRLRHNSNPPNGHITAALSAMDWPMASSYPNT